MIADLINETDFDLCAYAAEMENVCALTLKEEGFPKEAELSIVVVSGSKIRTLNKRYRKTDKETDVLSFPSHSITPGDYGGLADAPVYLGDIVISIERALAQAEEYGHSLHRELAFLTAHSVLHLLGYDHLSAEGDAIMNEKQENILREAGLAR